jgi:polyhydroxyalkanoate synthase
MKSPRASLVQLIEEWQWSLDGRLLEASRNPFLIRGASLSMNAWFDWLALSGAYLPWHPFAMTADFRQKALLATARAMSPTVAATRCEVLPLIGAATLRHYPARKTSAFPILIVNSLINRHYIFDLHADRSFVSFLTDAGFDVFTIDWGNPGAAERAAGLDHFADAVIAEAVRKIGRPRVNLLGYSMGGVLATTFAAVHPEAVAALVLLGTPADFSKDEPLRSWLADETFDPRRAAELFGNLPGWFVSGSFRSVKPFTALTKPVLAMLDPDELPTHLAIEVWLADAAAIPGGFYADFVDAYYRRNALWEGTLRLDGTKNAELGDIACPVLNIYGTRDQIVNPLSAAALADRIRPGNYAEHAVPLGHLALTIGRSAVGDVWPVIADWLGRSTRSRSN